MKKSIPPHKFISVSLFEDSHPKSKNFNAVIVHEPVSITDKPDIAIKNDMREDLYKCKLIQGAKEDNWAAFLKRVSIDCSK